MDKLLCGNEFVDDDDDDDIPLSELINRQLKDNLNEPVIDGITNDYTDFSFEHIELFDENVQVIVEEGDDVSQYVNSDAILLSFSDICSPSEAAAEIIVATEVSDMEVECESDTIINSDIEIEAVSNSESDVLFASEELHSYAKQPQVNTDKCKRQSRKKNRNCGEWKETIRKRKRNNGDEYINKTGKRVPMRMSYEASCNCKYKCRVKVSQQTREAAFHKYWKLSYSEKRQFLRQQVIVIDKKSRRAEKENSRRNKTLQYFMQLDENSNVQVCKVFFLQALGIKERTVTYNLRDDIGLNDKRGRSTKQKITEEQKNSIREHINSYPTVESHYCRSQSQRKYLNKELNVKKMYREYCDSCKSNCTEPKKWWLYNYIFQNEFNLHFHKPKKDLCSFCESFKNLSKDDQEKKQNEYNNHQKRKMEIREQKANDKIKATESGGTIKLINFDLQKVLQSPKTDIGEVYYSRKFSTYNFTVFDVISKQAECYMWHECLAKRGSCEISSCLYNYNMSLGKVEHIIYYSDSCTGQQRNLPFSCMCLYSVVNLPINKITHNYFERGHSQMEGDSVHATIERHTKSKDVYSPSGWIHAVSSSKQSSPKYNVREVNQSDLHVYNFKQLSDDTVLNRNKATDGSTIEWNRIRCFEYRKDEPNCSYCKYKSDAQWIIIDITESRQRRRRSVHAMSGYRLSPLYKGLLLISEQKYRDLNSLCDKNIIPPEYHSIYRDLPHGNVISRLSEPNESDASDGE